VTESAFEIVLTPPARRAIAEELPESVAAAAIDFITTVLLENPHRVGKPLRNDLAGVWSVRRGTYRVLYRIQENRREVVVLRIDHRRDAYRPLT
jgi:mRNA-degrading endonuclease RelE of RelBE toxin-antitoxin system